MPPRRSTRASLPTPASTVASPSDSVANRAAFSSRKGLQTPTSIGDENSVAQELGEELSPQKIKSEVEDSPTSANGSSKRYRLDSVTIPSRRSKLSLDKTDSADNLTLGSPFSKNGHLPQNDGLEVKVEDDAKPVMNGSASRRKGKSKEDLAAQAPFNIGKFSSVSKASAADLALDQPPRRSARASLGKTKAQVKNELTPPATDESEYEEKGDEDYAMDSDDEERQLKQAIQASTKGARNGSASSSRASSAKNTPTGSKKTRGNQAALRAAVAKAAEKRMKGSAKSTPSARGRTTGDVTPYSTGSAAGTDVTPLSDDDSGLSTALSEISADEAEMATESETDFTDSDSDDPLILRGKGKGKGKTKGKKFAGRGRKLDGEWDEDIANELGSEGEGLDPYEQRMMTLAKARQRAREERRAAEESAQPRKKKERALSEKLGRKLTNGEKNLIALSMASLAEYCCKPWGLLI
ncbi:hypothetical protein I317_02641 [Kwoniella heveanensis CBS 569]|nr:hypothetical protein I317_02641 [Kwoniella heveanensis CBS 569]